MDEHRFGLSPEDDQPVEPSEALAPPTGEPASTTPPAPEPPAPAAEREDPPVAPPAPEPPAPLAGGGAGGSEPPRPPVPFFAEQTPPAAAPGPQLAVGELATYGSRVVGFLLDGVLLFAAGLAVLLVFRAVLGSSNAANPAVVVGGYLIPFSYTTYLISQRGQTVGMRVAKVRCVMADGSELTTGRAAGRSAMALVMGIIPYVGQLVDLLFPVWDKKRQTVHDKVVGTVVVKVQADPDLLPPLS